jgi:cell division protein FtsW (lipid II flippase)
VNLMRNQRRSIVIFSVASLMAVVGGCVAMAQSGVAPASWLRTIVAWAVGAGLAALLARYGETRRVSSGVVVLTTGALIATLFARDVEGIHRWLDIGPLHINAAALFLPAMIIALAAIGIARPMAVVSASIAATVLLLQPDASQLTSFAIAASILLLRSNVTTRWKAFALVVAVVFAVAGWTRPDTLQPVAEVEQIFTMCFAVSPFLALVAGLALAAAAAAPLVFSSSTADRARDGAIALSAYLLSVSIAPFFGWFPVPLVGLGMSFPVGFWLGLGLLLAIARRLNDQMSHVSDLAHAPHRRPPRI